MGDIGLVRTFACLAVASLALVGCQADSKADLHSLADTRATATVTPTVTATAAALTRTPTASATPTPTVARTTAKPAPKPTVKTTPKPRPVVAVAKTDPRFGTCKAAKAAGYGPYRMGIDPEYYWYRDADHDGIDCE